MVELLKPIVETYPWCSLLSLLVLGVSLSEALPATVRALRGMPEPSQKFTRDDDTEEQA